MIILPRVSSDRCIAALVRAGLEVKLANERGTALWRDGRVVIVPPSREALTEAELALILCAARVSWKEFAALVEPDAFSPKTSGTRMRVRDDEEREDDDPIFTRPYGSDEQRR